MTQSLIASFGACLISAMVFGQNTFPSSGNVGIGTTSPGTPLQVVGIGNVISLGEASNSSGHQLIFGVNNSGNGYGTIQSVYQNVAYTPLILNNNGGNVGIGTTSPMMPMQVGAGLTLTGNWPTIGFNFYNNGSWTYLNSNAASYIQEDYNHQGLAFIVSPPGTANTAASTVNEAFFINGTTGFVGIGATSPAYNLDVTGKIRSTAGVVYPDGSQQTTAWTGVLCGGDYAEAVETTELKAMYEPGDVLVISADAEGKVQKSTEPYATNVSGIYATKPGVIGKRESIAKVSDDIPMAMVGIVPTKVTAENGAIHPGDLLVTSSRVGHAMKGTDRSRLVGAVIGKAMGTLDSGEGVVEVLVTLQ